MPRTKRKNKSSKLSIQKRWCTETKTENNMDISEHNSNVAQLSSGDSIFKNERVSMQEKSVLEQENVADTYDGPSYIIVDKNALCDIFNLKIYGPDVEILKEECINHVSKRLGTSLRNIVKDWRAKGITLGGKSYGSLKETTIKKLTQYYQKAILENKGDIQGMKKSIYATLYHSISTDKNPMHMKCPPGKDSWCFYRRALAKGEKPAPHKFNIGTPINPDYLTKFVLIYQRLASDSLLKGCARCLTQNSNESLHSVIWSKCSMETSAKSRRVNIAVSEAVSEYNFGTLKALKEIQKAANLDLGEEAVKIAATRDYRRKKRNRQSNLAFRIARRKFPFAPKRFFPLMQNVISEHPVSRFAALGDVLEIESQKGLMLRRSCQTLCQLISTDRLLTAQMSFVAQYGVQCDWGGHLSFNCVTLERDLLGETTRVGSSLSAALLSSSNDAYRCRNPPIPVMHSVFSNEFRTWKIFEEVWSNDSP
ncbi:uncharacterized protein TNCV_2759531 [Trichonephila clavipes]|nr:uncharacterized protein TNCV_2759531 [Trichonephila clavipes]